MVGADPGERACPCACDPRGARWEEPGWCCGAADGAGGGAFDVDVDGGGDAGGGGAAVPVVDGGVVPTGAHDSAIPTTGSETGSDNDDSGVPGGTSTVKFSFTPPAMVTVTVHDCAPALAGTAASPTTSDPVAAAISTLRGRRAPARAER